MMCMLLTDATRISSDDHCYALLLVSFGRVYAEGHILLLPLHRLHALQYPLPRTRYDYGEEGAHLSAPLVFIRHILIHPQASNTRRVFVSLAFLAVLSFTLTASTYTHPAPGIFNVFVLLNAVGQAAAGSYLQTAVVAVASLFGPLAMQAVMSGQAAVAVAISGIQVISAVASVRGTSPQEILPSSEPAEQSAFFFFAISTVFLVVCAGVHTWLTKLPAYKSIVSRAATHGHSASPEGAGLLGGSADPDDHEHWKEDSKHQVVRIAKTNGIYNIAVSYVFVVTLVCHCPVNFDTWLTASQSRLSSRP